MTQQESINGNKLIAEFMGVKIVKRNDEDAVFMFKNAAFPEYFRCTIHNEYNSNWNALMPVVEKICQFKYKDEEDSYLRTFGAVNQAGEFMVRFNRQILFASPHLINATWHAVIDFIKWYNEIK